MGNLLNSSQKKLGIVPEAEIFEPSQRRQWGDPSYSLAHLP